MRFKIVNSLAITGLLFVVSSMASAQNHEFFNSGVDKFHTSLSVGLTDSHFGLNYSGIDSSGNPVSYTEAVASSSEPWLPNDANSMWINGTGSGNTNISVSVEGVYHYTYITDVKNLTSVSGRWASDNEAVMSLNGGPTITSTGNPYDAGTFQKWHDFTLTGFNTSGSNTIHFDVTNDHQTNGNPTGLRVEFTSVKAVPEPFTMALAIGGLGLAARRRLQKSA